MLDLLANERVSSKKEGGKISKSSYEDAFSSKAVFSNKQSVLMDPSVDLFWLLIDN